MAVRAGWIGKNCAALYPRCARSTDQRPSWSVTQDPVQDSDNLASTNVPVVKVRPPLDFSPPPARPTTSKATTTTTTTRTTTTPRPTTTNTPSTTTTTTTTPPPPPPPPKQLTPGPLAVKKPAAAPAVLPSRGQGQARPVPVQKLPATNLGRPLNLNHRDSESDSDEYESSDETHSHSWGAQAVPQAPASPAPPSGQAVVNRAPLSPLSAENGGTLKPWGKPSRLSNSAEISLSDIVRGIYPPVPVADVSQEETNEGGHGQQGHPSSSDSSSASEETAENVSVEHAGSDSTILHDLKTNHFNEKIKPVATDTRQPMPMPTPPPAPTPTPTPTPTAQGRLSTYSCLLCVIVSFIHAAYCC